MPITSLPWDDQDFLDMKEPVVIQDMPSGVGGFDPFTITNAVRYDVSLKEAAESNGVYLSGDVVWTLPISPDNNYQPRPGSTITDNQGFPPGSTVPYPAVYTVLEVQTGVASYHYVLHTRQLAIHPDIGTTVNLQTPTITTTAGLGRTTSWATIRSTISCRIQPQTVESFNERGVLAAETMYDVTIDPRTGTGSAFAAKNATGDWNRLLDGSTVYQIVGYDNAERLEALPVAKCVRMP
jgi:hypothetical protein